MSLERHELDAMVIMIATAREPPPPFGPAYNFLPPNKRECPLERLPRPPHSQLCSSSASCYPVIVHCSKLPLHTSASASKTPPLYLVISTHLVPNLSWG